MQSRCSTAMESPLHGAAYVSQQDNESSTALVTLRYRVESSITCVRTCFLSRACDTSGVTVQCDSV